LAHVQISRLSKTFSVRTGKTVKPLQALADVSFEVEAGEIVALAGPSGCGKTTALRILMGLETPTAGTVSVAGRPVKGCGLDRAMVFQHAELLPWKSARENIKFALAAAKGREARHDAVADEYLDLVNLGHAADRLPHQLSGGMKQRVGIARALAIDPDVLLMDEPFGALDSHTRESLQMEVLAIHERTRKTIVFVTHDLDEAVLLADRVVVMDAGRVREIIPVNLRRPRRDPRAIRAEPEFLDKRNRIWAALHGQPAEADVQRPRPSTSSG
jgi:NitT/TauT family transport system ATP-binding protein